MRRSYASCDAGRIIRYESEDGRFVSQVMPEVRGGWFVVSTDTCRPGTARTEGRFRSEKEAMDQARSRVRWYERWPNGAPWERAEGGR